MILLVAILFTLLFFLLVGAMYVFARVPEPSAIARAQSVVVIDSRGRSLGRISAGADRVSVPLSQMPQDLRDAVVATEDRQFYHHHGIRVTSIFRAALANVFRRGIAQGGSTITQQYVKNAFLGSQRTIFRKISEAVLAVKFERKHTKEEILEDYLNTIYFGRGAYGCEAAASTYFGVHCRNLDLAQSALLAGIIHAPEAYDPGHHPESSNARRDHVLASMVRDHYITKPEAEKAKTAKVHIRPRLTGCPSAPHFCLEVQHELEKRVGGSIYTGGLRVKTTLDVRMQTAALDAVRTTYDKASDPDAALVAVDPRTGAVRAWVGSRDFSKRQQDLLLARRRPGSTFKPVVLTAAVKKKISIHEVFPAPARITLHDQPYENYGGEAFGSLDIEQATAHSVNTVYVQLMDKVGVQNAIDVARDLGIGSKLNYDLGLALGDSNVTPLELATMYSTLASRGARNEPYLVEEVTDHEGHTLFKHEAAPVGTIAHDVADTVTSVLQGVITNGTGRAAAIGRPAAGKTGTTDDNTDAWFAGYTPQLCAVVWNGYAEAERPMNNVRGISVTGGSFPARIWNKFMSRAMEGTPVAQFRSAPPQPGASGTPSPSPHGTVPAPGETKTLPPVPSPSLKPSRSPSPSVSGSPVAAPSPSKS